jgi:uncharacterized RDD family membrane protein YckC
LWAPFIDSALLWPIGVALRLSLNFLSIEDETVHLFANNVVAFIYPCYSIYFHGHYDATPGKMACKIRLLNAKREKSMSTTRAFFRDFPPLAVMVGIFSWVLLVENTDEVVPSLALYAIPVIYYIWLLIEIVTMPFNRRGRAFQDYLAGTVVVRAD